MSALPPIATAKADIGKPRMRVYDARVIDEQITEREQRLAELG
jgi:hypothetical protein